MAITGASASLTIALAPVAAKLQTISQDLYARFCDPPDDSLPALRRAIALHPYEETPLMQLIDRLHELNRPDLASFAEFQLANLRYTRLWRDLIRGFGLPPSLVS